jgi:hypothetical protein
MSIYPNDDDGAVLADLAAQGIDMSQPLLLDFQVHAPDQAAADAIGKALRQAGYDIEVVYDEGEPDEDGDIDPEDEEFGPSWTVYVNREMVPEYHEIMRIQADLDRLARPHGGKSDGWGAMLDEEG